MKLRIRRSGNLHGVVLTTALLLGAALAAPIAKADPLLPAFVKKHLDMPFVPDCTICHGDDRGGIGNFRRVTGTGDPGMGYILSRQYSLDPLDQSTWGPALDQLKADAWDTDGDGTPDTVELVTGDPKGGGMPTDPNNPTPGASIEPDAPTYGCARVNPHGRVDGVASAVSAAVLALGVALLRKRRAR